MKYGAKWGTRVGAQMCAHRNVPMSSLLRRIADKVPVERPEKKKKMELAPTAKYSADEIRAIRIASAKKTIQQLADEYGDTYNHMRQIIAGEIYAKVF